MKRSGSGVSFYVETALLVLAAVFVTAVLVCAFTIAKRESTQSKLLTSAVQLAENAAEAAAGSDAPEALYDILNENNGQSSVNESGLKVLDFYYDRQEKPALAENAAFKTEIVWDEEPHENGKLANTEITVYSLGSGRAVYVYALQTSHYVREAADE